MVKLIRRIKETREYAVIGTADSSGSTYWNKDFKEMSRVQVGEAQEIQLEGLREMSGIEEALFAKIVLISRRDDDDR